MVSFIGIICFLSGMSAIHAKDYAACDAECGEEEGRLWAAWIKGGTDADFQFIEFQVRTCKSICIENEFKRCSSACHKPPFNSRRRHGVSCKKICRDKAKTNCGWNCELNDTICWGGCQERYRVKK